MMGMIRAEVLDFVNVFEVSQEVVLKVAGFEECDLYLLCSWECKTQPCLDLVMRIRSNRCRHASEAFVACGMMWLTTAFVHPHNSYGTTTNYVSKISGQHPTLF